jgi:hypothetical protein
LILPDCGSTIGSYKVAVFGINFLPRSQFHIRFGGDVTATDIEFHSSTAVIATLHVGARALNPGVVRVAATNDGGAHFGPSTQFRFFDPITNLNAMPAEQRLLLVTSQMENLRRSIFQLQAGVVNVHRMELQLRSQMKDVELAPIDMITIEENALDDDTENTKLLEPGASVAGAATSPPTAAASGAATTATKQSTSSSSSSSSPSGAPMPGVRIIRPEDREVRLFISSPFRDMQEERDTIVKHVIPTIRKLCAQRDINFSYVDLRWGVTDTQTEQAATLLMCLREVDKCNIFVGCYGERYGWCLSQNAARNPSPSDELLRRSMDMASKEFPWLNELRDRSVTEIEMRMVRRQRRR